MQIANIFKGGLGGRLVLLDCNDSDMDQVSGENAQTKDGVFRNKGSCFDVEPMMQTNSFSSTGVEGTAISFHQAHADGTRNEYFGGDCSNHEGRVQSRKHPSPLPEGEHAA